jgi:rod shape-determining protein MreC
MRRSPFLFLFVLLLICAGAVWWQKSSSRPERGGMSLPAGASLAVLSPFGRALNGVGAWASDVGRALFRRDGIVAENERLRARVAELQTQNDALKPLQRENDEMRRLMKLPAIGGGRIVNANVVAYDATDVARSLVLNVGSRQGVRAKDVVYAADGVVGQVATVSPSVCTVLLLTDLRSGIGARTGRNGARGVLQGQGGGGEALCKLAYLPDWADVREGDTVLTSGEVRGRGQIYPGGMTLGRIVRVRKNKTLSQTEAFVLPSADLSRLDVVRVRTAESKG